MALNNSTNGSADNHHQQEMIACRCSDGVVVEVPVGELRHSRLFDTLYTNLGGEGSFEGEFPVQWVDSVTMVKVREWCHEHIGRSLILYPLTAPTNPTLPLQASQPQ